MRGLRYPVKTLLELLASGMTTEEILADYPELERDDVLAALEFAALALGMGRATPLSAARSSLSTRSSLLTSSPCSARQDTL